MQMDGERLGRVAVQVVWSTERVAEAEAGVRGSQALSQGTGAGALALTCYGIGQRAQQMHFSSFPLSLLLPYLALCPALGYIRSPVPHL